MKQKILLVICILLIANVGTTLAEKTSPTNRAMITPLQPVQTQLEQVALVIGNNDYGFAPLENAVNDATRVAAVLKQKGFKVLLRTNLTYARMMDAVREFEVELAAKKDVGLLFYAGHGVQIKGENFLIPINNQEMRNEMDVQDKALNVEDMTRRMKESRVKLSVVILDACRDNPFKSTTTSRSLTRGLTPMQVAEGMVIAFATDPGSTASDGDGGQGLYTKYLVEALQTPGLEIEKVFKQVLKRVKDASGGKQKPWYNASVEGTFCFGGCENSDKAAAEAAEDERKRVLAEQQRIAAEKATAAKVAEDERKRVLAEQQQKIATEKATAAKVAEDERKRVLAEQQRIATEKATAAKVAEDERKRVLAEQQRIAAEKATAAKVAEDERKRLLAEQQRIATEKATAAKIAEDERKRLLAEQQRIAAEKAATAKEAESGAGQTGSNPAPVEPTAAAPPPIVTEEVEPQPQPPVGAKTRSIPMIGF